MHCSWSTVNAEVNLIDGIHHHHHYYHDSTTPIAPPPRSSNPVQGVPASLAAEDDMPLYNIKTIFSADEFVSFVKANGASASLFGYIFLAVDLRYVDPHLLETLDVKGAYFLGCQFHISTSIGSLIAAGAKVVQNPKNLPFKPFRSTMYRTDELQRNDIPIFDFSKNDSALNIITKNYMATHDENVVQHLLRFKEGKRLVGVMGGHAALRGSKVFYQTMVLSRTLAQLGFYIVTGGGPGLMEAANLGAYLADKSDLEFEDAYKMLQVGDDLCNTSNPEGQCQHEYENSAGADAVIAKYGMPLDQRSLGVATWVYGHEPFNRFCAWDAKLFSNAIREDILLAVLNNGVIIGDGAAGTRQEMWQDQTASSYADEKQVFSRPQIYLGTFWFDNNMFQTMYQIGKAESQKNGKKYGYEKKLYYNQSKEQIVRILTNYRDQIVARNQDVDALVDHTRNHEIVSSEGSGIQTIRNSDPEFASTMQGVFDVSQKFTNIEVREQALQYAVGVASAVNLALTAKQADGGFIPRETTSLLTFQTLTELQEHLAESVGDLQQGHVEEPGIDDFCNELISISESLISIQDSQKLIEKFQDLVNLRQSFLNESAFEGKESAVSFSLGVHNGIVTSKPDGEMLTAISEKVAEDKRDASFLGSLSTLLSQTRKHNTTKVLQMPDQISLQLAYKMLSQGTPVPTAYKSLGLPGHRDFTQTYIFVTDPGPGHLEVTTRDNALMQGVTVHNEYIDRGTIDDKDIVEAYRLPAHLYTAQVRLHVGVEAPCSAFIGRPTFEGLGYNDSLEDPAFFAQYEQTLFDVDKLKTIHMTASACTAMFKNGVADAKIAIEKMNDVEAIEFMNGVVANTLRDPNRQYFAAAFNLYTDFPIKDGKTLTDKMDLARNAIRIAVEGHFEKVTWDGATGRKPSFPILGTGEVGDTSNATLEFEDLVDLVHEAHEHGLITYISAGMKTQQVANAVYTGVDGIGIGTSLHYVNAENEIGAFKPEYIKEILQVRNTAADTSRGKAAACLARLDYKYFECSLDMSVDAVRLDLLTAVRGKDLAKMESILNDDANYCEQKSTTGHKTLDKTNRLLGAETPMIANVIGNWPEVKESIRSLRESGAYAEIEAVLAKALEKSKQKQQRKKTLFMSRSYASAASAPLDAVFMSRSYATAASNPLDAAPVASARLSNKNDDYYQNINTEDPSTIKAQLGPLLLDHKVFSYTPGVWTTCAAIAPYINDTEHCADDDKIPDVYSSYCWDKTGKGMGKQCGAGRKEGDCWNREHIWPKSWFGVKKPSGRYPGSVDVFELYPSDSKVNGLRGNLPFGEVSKPTNTSTNGAKVGSCDTSGSPSKCFEPPDYLKGKFARAYFYMSTTYASKWTCCDKEGVNGASIKPWMEALLRKWHTAFPVTSQEQAYNDVVFNLQHNRNPFIDHPEWVELISDF